MSDEHTIESPQRDPTQDQHPTPEVKQDLKGQLQQEQKALQELVAQATKPLQDQLATLGAALKARDAQLSKLSQDFEGAKAAYAYAVADFKKLMVLANPLYTEELIAGSTIEELKASGEKANAIIARLREGLQHANHTEAAAARIPAGAPTRSGPDISVMTATEKINYGLEQAKKKK